MCVYVGGGGAVVAELQRHHTYIARVSSRNFGLGWKGRGNFTTYFPPSIAESIYFGWRGGDSKQVYASPPFSFSLSPPLSLPLFFSPFLPINFLLSFFFGELGALEGKLPPHWMKLCISAWHCTCTTLLRSTSMFECCYNIVLRLKAG